MAVGARSPFGEQLRRLREAAGLTQEELAERAGLSVQAVAALESGRRQRPYPHTAQALADALGLSGEERDEFLATPRGRAGRPDVSPPEPEPEPGRRYLPVPPTPLVGREREVGEMRALLGGDVRLVTLTGPGGVGKTRLALEVASRAGEGFPDGATFVSLAPVGEPALVVPTVARSLGMTEVAGQPLPETLRSYLRDRRMLLVMDNFEQVLDAAPEVADLLSSCQGLTVLVTSRAPLRVRGEREYPVGPLGLPGLSRVPAPDDAAGSDAVRLFVERASEVSPAFELTQANAAAVAAICRRLDGLPLALELAAARIRSLSPTELLARLDRALPLLTGGARDLPERQRTMRAAIEWSYQLLGEPQWRLLNRLSVFRGGWDLEAAEAVGAGGDILEEEVLDLLSSLVEQSLVVAEATDDGTTRYRMLVPVREYAEDRLELSGEARETRLRHAGYFLALAEEAESALKGSHSMEMLDQLDRENDNLRAAMGFMLAHRNVGDIARMAWGLWLFWWVRGHFAEGRGRVDQALRCDPSVAPLAEGRLLSVAGTMVIGQGDQQGAEACYSRSRSLLEAAGDAPGQASACLGMGIIALGRGDSRHAESYLREGAAIYRRIGDTWRIGLTLSYLGLASLTQGDHDRAEALLEESITLMRRAGDRIGICVVLYNRSLLAQAQRDYDRVTALFAEVLVLSSEIGDYANIAYCMEGLAAVAVARGEAGRAATLLGAAKGLLEVLGAPVYTFRPDRSLYEHTVSSARGQLDERQWMAAWEQGRAMTMEQAVEYALALDERS